MPVVKKTKPVAASTATTKPVEKKTVTTTKKTTEVKAAPKKSVAPVEKKEVATKKISLTGAAKAPKTFDIKEGSQATQDAFIDRFYKKLLALNYDVTKEQVKNIKKAYSETLKDVTEIASYQDVDAGMFYARRYIEGRVTAPPKAKDGLKTFMAGHYELKVRKLLGDESEFKFFGELNEDGTAFIAHIFDEDGNDTGKTREISLTDEVEEEEVKPVVKPAAKKVVTKKAPVVEEVEEDEEEEIEIEEEEIEEVEEDDDDFLDDDDE
jgi:hypothetical protein